MERKQRILQGIADGMNLPGEGLPGITVAEIWGQGRVLIEHHRGVIGYCREEILVRVSFGELSVTGSNLQLTMMTREQLIISGTISGLCLKGKTVC